jgi:hypothetical protein
MGRITAERNTGWKDRRMGRIERVGDVHPSLLTSCPSSFAAILSIM